MTFPRSKIGSKFFESTRGKIILLLRNSRRTVNELTDALNISDNAVRSHLASLERDRLVEQAGTVKGFRKPHFSYTLTEEAQQLFPRSYDSLVNLLLEAIKERMSPSTLGSIMKDIGAKLAGERNGNGAKTLDERVNEALGRLESIGGSAVFERQGDQIVIKSESCPFGDAVAEHPEVCAIACSMLGEVIERPVVEDCDRTGSPKCCFKIDLAE